MRIRVCLYLRGYELVYEMKMRGSHWGNKHRGDKVTQPVYWHYIHANHHRGPTKLSNRVWGICLTGERTLLHHRSNL